LQPRHRPFVRHAVTGVVTERSLAPCAHRLGERTERQCRGRALSPHDSAQQSPSLPRLFAEPEPRFPASGFSAHRYRDPTRLPRIQSTVGDQPPRLDRGPTVRRRHNRGLASAFRPLRAVATFREENDDRPRPGPSPSCRWAMSPRRASRLSLDTSPRCFESASTTDVSRHEHPQQKHPLRRLPAEPPWENPPAFAFEILREHGVAASCSRKTPDHLAVIRPPTASCLTARCRLRVERRPRHAFALHGESAAAFSAASRFAGRTL